MAGVSASVRIEDDGFRPALEALLRRSSDLRPVFSEIGAALQTSAEERFEDEEDPDGRSWPAHSPATLLRRGSGARKLRDKGHLYQSLNWRASRLKAEVGTNRIYARIHQLGGEAGRGRKVEIPARPYLGVSAADRKEIAEILNDHLTKGLRR
ncbi:phage virion morphogenesis protein [Neomegalonema sp.]|uniref:phage virion morphogenesis protein n=1 Tax=Neomegalonema sp. TaxID=2039713 RepID=UPI002631C798|nr:phage virion morphogenesis protein [Neomegalonema sp.]MDD2870123.1 phage virion morphogenesis protein [Neomegalonema sp.]